MKSASFSFCQWRNASSSSASTALMASTSSGRPRCSPAPAGACRSPTYSVIVAAVGRERHQVDLQPVALAARALEAIRPQADDTVLVVGGHVPTPWRSATSNMRWSVGFRARRRSSGTSRSNSATAPSSSRAPAHPRRTARGDPLVLCYDRPGAPAPEIDVDREAIAVRDGRIWTSAGVTTEDRHGAGDDRGGDHDRRLADNAIARAPPCSTRAARGSSRSSWRGAGGADVSVRSRSPASKRVAAGQLPRAARRGQAGAPKPACPVRSFIAIACASSTTRPESSSRNCASGTLRTAHQPPRASRPEDHHHGPLRKTSGSTPRMAPR